MSNNEQQVAIYHLLHGKRSIQTVQDAHLFGLDRFYGVLPSMTKLYFDRMVKQYVNDGLLVRTIDEEQTYLEVTQQGKQKLRQSTFSYNYFNGLLYFDIDTVFLERLILLIQVLTNRHMNNSSYIPVVDKPEILDWIKRIYPQIKNDVHTYLQLLYEDLYNLLNMITDEEARLFVDRLTGYEHYGLSTHQLAKKYHLMPHDIPLYLRAITHSLLTILKKGEIKTRVVSQVVKDLPKLNFMTKSAQVTYQLIQKRLSAENIANIRHLKINTIYDHIVEIAWYDPDFPVHHYVDQYQIDQVKEAVMTTRSLQLKKIKEIVKDNITYFQIRLSLTRIKNVFSKGVLKNEK